MEPHYNYHGYSISVKLIVILNLFMLLYSNLSLHYYLPALFKRELIRKKISDRYKAFGMCFGCSMNEIIQAHCQFLKLEIYLRAT